MYVVYTPQEMYEPIEEMTLSDENNDQEEYVDVQPAADQGDYVAVEPSQLEVSALGERQIDSHCWLSLPVPRMRLKWNTRKRLSSSLLPLLPSHTLPTHTLPPHILHLHTDLTPQWTSARFTKWLQME